ncbi:hypothetical protein HZC31_06060 [Candidatus Woesearchaeota archaeon]|nr:hypothetical protein [Candidatus Woesearchaeota archaeon]
MNFSKKLRREDCEGGIMKRVSFYVIMFLIFSVFIPVSFASDSLNNTKKTYAVIGRYGCSENFIISDEEISSVNKSLYNLPQVSFIKEYPTSDDRLFSAEIHLSDESKRDVIYVTLLKNHWLLSYNFSDMGELEKGSGEEDVIQGVITTYKNCENYSNVMVRVYIINPIPDLGCDLFSSDFECRSNNNFSEIETSLFNTKFNDISVHFGASDSVYIMYGADWDNINKITSREIIFSETSLISNGHEQASIKKQSVFLSTVFYPAYYKEQQLGRLKEDIFDYEESLTGKFWFTILFFEHIPTKVSDYRIQLKDFQDFTSNAREELNKNGFYEEYYSYYLYPLLDRMELENQDAKERLNRILSIREEAKTSFILYLTICSIMMSVFIPWLIYYLEKRNNQESEKKAYGFLDNIKESITREGTNLKASIDNFRKEAINKKDELKEAVKKLDTSFSRVSTSVTHLSKDTTKVLNESNERQEKVISILKEIKEELEEPKL